MAQGNITKKDKVNIPDWVTTNSYLVNDFVINDNKFYRANGAIPANTGLTIGTTNATWTEMSPSAGGQFTLADSVLSTTNSIEAEGVIQSSEYIIGIFDLGVTFQAAANGVPEVFPLNGNVVSGDGISLNTTTHLISLTGLADTLNRLDFRLEGGFFNSSVSTVNNLAAVSFALGVTDDSGGTFSVVRKNVNMIATDNTITSGNFSVGWDSIEHAPGRQYILYVSITNVNIEIRGGIRFTDWGQGQGNSASGYTRLTIAPS